jgi:hypothetical protein
MPMSERQAQEIRLFRRLVISGKDLDHARRYAQLILTRKLHDSSEEDDKTIHRGLNLALVVSYWRPFTKNQGSAETLPGLPRKFLKAYSPDERKLHAEIGRLRNRGFAHSDGDAHGVRVQVRSFRGLKSAWSTSWNAHVPLPAEQTARLLGMIETLLGQMASEQMRIQALLPTESFL